MTDNSNVLFSDTVLVKEAFDIWNARHKLRTQLHNLQILAMSSNLKISIVLTALGELISCMQIDQAIPVSMQVTESYDDCYFEYFCSIPVKLIKNRNYHRYQLNLEEVSSDFEMQQRRSNMEITGSVPMGPFQQVRKV